VGEANGGIPGAHAYKGYAGGVFLLAEQTSTGGGPAAKPIEFFGVMPAEGATNVHPNTPITVVLKYGDFAVNPASVKLTLDGNEVTPTVAPGDASAFVSFQPAAMLASLSTHAVRLEFTDNSPAAKAYAKEWSFVVLDYSGFPTLPASLAIPFDPTQYQQRGFALKIAAPDPIYGIPITTIEEAAAVWDQQFDNLVDPALLNELGYYLERTTINYQIDGNPIGNKAGDRLFPGIPGSGQDGEQFALQLFTLLRLRPGYYHLNITMTDGFKLWVGQGEAETELNFTFTPCTNCGGDDAPWFTDFLVAQEGLYPFRLLFFNAGGSASLEWLEVAPTNLRYLINEDAPGAIAAYIPLDTVPALPVLAIRREGANLVISWTGGGGLQSASQVTGPWTDVNAANPYTVQPAGARQFYRVRK